MSAQEVKQRFSIRTTVLTYQEIGKVSNCFPKIKIKNVMNSPPNCTFLKTKNKSNSKKEKTDNIIDHQMFMKSVFFNSIILFLQNDGGNKKFTRVIKNPCKVN